MHASIWSLVRDKVGFWEDGNMHEILCHHLGEPWQSGVRKLAEHRQALESATLFTGELQAGRDFIHASKSPSAG
jgi:hypothetical protein